MDVVIRPLNNRSAQVGILCKPANPGPFPYLTGPHGPGQQSKHHPEAGAQGFAPLFLA